MAKGPAVARGFGQGFPEGLLELCSIRTLPPCSDVAVGFRVHIIPKS